MEQWGCIHKHSQQGKGFREVFTLWLALHLNSAEDTEPKMLFQKRFYNTHFFPPHKFTDSLKKKTLQVPIVKKGIRKDRLLPWRVSTLVRDTVRYAKCWNRWWWCVRHHRPTEERVADLFWRIQRHLIDVSETERTLKNYSFKGFGSNLTFCPFQSIP